MSKLLGGSCHAGVGSTGFTASPRVKQPESIGKGVFVVTIVFEFK